MKCKSLRTAAALVLALVMTFPSVFASPAGEQTWQVQDTLADGVTYLDTVSLHSSYGREELYSLRFTPGGAVKPIVLTGDSTIYGRCNHQWGHRTRSVSGVPCAGSSQR